MPWVDLAWLGDGEIKASSESVEVWHAEEVKG